MKELYNIVNEEALTNEERAMEVYASLAVSLFMDNDDIEDIIYGSSSSRIDSIDDYVLYLSMECDKQEIDRYMHKLHSKYPECRKYAIKEIAEIKYAVGEFKSPSIIWWTNLPTTIFEDTDNKYRKIISEKMANFKDDIVIDKIYSSFVNDHIQRAKGYDQESVIIEIYCNNSITASKIKVVLEKEFGGYESTY